MVKVNGKIFVLLGEEGDEPGLSVKLWDSLEQALSFGGVAPIGYGLGRSGWVYVRLKQARASHGVLRDWIEESYRLMAAKRLVVELEGKASAIPSRGST